MMTTTDVAKPQDKGVLCAKLDQLEKQIEYLDRILEIVDGLKQIGSGQIPKPASRSRPKGKSTQGTDHASPAAAAAGPDLAKRRVPSDKVG